MGKSWSCEPAILTVRNVLGDEMGTVLITDDDWGIYHARCTACGTTARRPSSMTAALTWLRDHDHDETGLRLEAGLRAQRAVS